MSGVPKDLLADFPNLYEDVYCGFSCGPGWLGIIRELSEVLEPLGVKATQVKEKFAGLRFYTAPLPEEIRDKARDAIQLATTKANKTCELCGKEGSLHKKNTGSLLCTLCKACADTEGFSPRSWDDELVSF